MLSVDSIIAAQSFILQLLYLYFTFQAWKQYEFWCEGVLFSSLGLFGLISNIASIVTLLSPDMRKQTFNQLLAVLAIYDILYENRNQSRSISAVIFPPRYIVFNVPVHANATLSTVNHWFSVSEILSWVRMISKLTEKCNFLLPFRAMFMCFTRCLQLLFAHQSTWLSLSLWKGEYTRKSQTDWLSMLYGILGMVLISV